MSTQGPQSRLGGDARRALPCLVAALLLAASIWPGWLGAPAADARPPAATGDENWSAAFDTKGLNGRVYAMTVYNGALIVGGSFTATSDGSTTLLHIARWDGQSWSPLGAGITGSTAHVNALAVLGNDLYVGGFFGDIDGNVVNGIARWNGTAWQQPMSAGVQAGQTVFALAASGTDLFVGGNFTSASGVPASGVARWNGSSWSAVGAGLNGQVSALAFSGPTLYAAGTLLDGTTPYGVARWDGANWTLPGASVDADASALAAGSGGNLVAGGAFQNAGGNPAAHIARWDGAVWSALGDGLGAFATDNVQALAFDGADLYAGGQFTLSGATEVRNLARWDGAAWSPLGSGVDAVVDAIAVYNGGLYVGGTLQQAGGKPSHGIGRWALPAPPSTPTATATSTAPTATTTATATRTSTRTVTATGTATATRTATATATANATRTSTVAAPLTTPTRTATLPAGAATPSRTATAGAGGPPAATATAGAAATATATSTAAPGGSLGNLRLITPIRVADTRLGHGVGLGGATVAAQPLRAFYVNYFLLAGQRFGNAARLPADLSGVLLNVTIVAPQPGGGYVVVYPGDAPSPPNASTVNPSTAIAANFWATAVPTSGPQAGAIAIYSTLDLDVILDLVGFYAPSNPPALSGLTFVTPVRVLDTRVGSAVGFNPDGFPVAAGPLVPDTIRRFAVSAHSFNTGLGTVTFPANTAGLLAHVTVVQDQPSGGFVTLLPGSASTRPGTSTVNPSTTIAFNGWATAIPTADEGYGTFGLYSTNASDVVVDVVGYWTDNPTSPGDGALSLIAPVRAIDTRADAGGPLGLLPGGQPAGAAPLQPGETRRYHLAGGASPALRLPPGARGIFANVTLVQPVPSGGFATLYPADAPGRPGVSTVNPVAAVAASFWATGLPTAGAEVGNLAVYSTNQADVIVDVLGYLR